MGVALYERLQQQSDEALTAGNLSRNEIKTSLDETRNYL